MYNIHVNPLIPHFTENFDLLHMHQSQNLELFKCRQDVGPDPYILAKILHNSAITPLLFQHLCIICRNIPYIYDE